MSYPVIDLHMHSSFSDGTDTPEELFEKVKSAAIDIFAITDHDEYLGVKEMLAGVTGGGSRFIAGVEFSCRDECGKYHVLGYHYDLESEDMLAMFTRFHELRLRKAVKRVEWLTSEYGFHFQQAELDELFSHKNPGKPHIANMVVRNGYAPDRSTAINNYISTCPYTEYVRPEEAITAIIKGGGIPVLAHGFFGNGEQRNNPLTACEMETRIIRLKAMGLKGLECFYYGFTKEQTELMLGLKDKHGMFATAGSDYHGKNKTVRLGDAGPAAIADPERVYKELQPFLKACGVF